MRLLKKYRYEFLSISLVTALLIFSFYLLFGNYAVKSIRFALFVLVIADAIGLYFTFRKLWRTKWKRLFLASVQKIVAKISKLLTIFIEKHMKKEKVTILSGKTTVSFDLSLQELKNQKSSKPLKWKKLKNNRERLGYLYRNMIEHKIKHGSLIYSSDTPSEVKDKSENEVVENRIFDLYIDNRYKDTIDVDTERLNDLKSELNKSA